MVKLLPALKCKTLLRPKNMNAFYLTCLISFRDSRKHAYVCETWVKFPEIETSDNDLMSAAWMDDSPEMLTLNELMAAQRVVESE